MHSTSNAQSNHISKLFPLETMELSFIYLRDPYPSLALTLQNQLYKTSRRNQEDDINQTLLTLSIDQASEIIIALSNIAEDFAEDSYSGKEQLIQIRSLLLDWLIYAQSSIEEFNTRI